MGDAKDLGPATVLNSRGLCVSSNKEVIWNIELDTRARGVVYINIGNEEVLSKSTWSTSMPLISTICCSSTGRLLYHPRQSFHNDVHPVEVRFRRDDPNHVPSDRSACGYGNSWRPNTKDKALARRNKAWSKVCLGDFGCELDRYCVIGDPSLRRNERKGTSGALEVVIPAARSGCIS